jgi:hypothetical protein
MMRWRKRFVEVLGCLSLLAAFVLCAAAQSTDQALPTAIYSNEVTGRINPLDLGDPRMTRHFYAFEGTPGDLLITVDGKNLNGDVDVFTAVTFRPMMKTTIYADRQSQEVTKSLYLRAAQIFILRVEARTPNDDPGTYHIRFGGTFAKFSGGIPVAEPVETTETESERSSSNRLSSVGATIPRPVEEKVETPEIKTEKPAEETAAPAKKETAPRRSTSRRTNPRSNPRRTPTRPAKKPAVKTEPAETAKTEIKETEEKPPEAAEKEKSQEILPQLTAGQLVIEKKDGTRIDRPMSSVRRVTIDGTAIVIVMKNGRIDRIPMSMVSRMGIEPQ